MQETPVLECDLLWLFKHLYTIIKSVQARRCNCLLVALRSADMMVRHGLISSKYCIAKASSGNRKQNLPTLKLQVLHWICVSLISNNSRAEHAFMAVLWQFCSCLKDRFLFHHQQNVSCWHWFTHWLDTVLQVPGSIHRSCFDKLRLVEVYGLWLTGSSSV